MIDFDSQVFEDFVFFLVENNRHCFSIFLFTGSSDASAVGLKFLQDSIYTIWFPFRHRIETSLSLIQIEYLESQLKYPSTVSTLVRRSKKLSTTETLSKNGNKELISL